MNVESKTLKLSEFRERIVESEEAIFSKKILGGYNPKEVMDHIRVMNDRLRFAEISFKTELEDYNSMNIMLTHERDQYLNQLNNLNKFNNDLKEKLDSLTEINKDLIHKNKVLEGNTLSQKDIQIYEETFNHNIELENRMVTFEKLKEVNTDLMNKVEILEDAIRKQNEQIEKFNKNDTAEKERFKQQYEEFELLLSENLIIKKQYDKVIDEKNMLIVDNKILSDENKRIGENLEQVNEFLRELKDSNIKIKLDARNLISEFDSKAYEFTQYHERNMKVIHDNVKNILVLLDSGSADISKFHKRPYTEITIEPNLEGIKNSL